MTGLKRPRLSGERIALRPPREGDREALSGWYEPPAIDRRPQVLVITRAGEDAPVGVIEYRRERSRLVFERVMEAPQARGFGYGLEAVRIIERDAGERGRARRFEAEISPDEGLSLYFWLRLGYRPVAWPRGEGRRIISAVRAIE